MALAAASIKLYAVLEGPGPTAATSRLRTGPKRGVTMAIAFQHGHFRLDAHHPFWLWFATVLAFILAALWANPIG